MFCYFFFVKGSNPTEIEKTSSGVKTISTDSYQGIGIFLIASFSSRSPKCCYFFFVKGSHPTEIEKTSSGVKTISTDSYKGTYWYIFDCKL